MLKSLKTLSAIFLMAGLAHADGGDGGDVMQHVVYLPDDLNVAEPVGERMTCKEARETAWFVNELARTDGDANPGAPYVACDAERQIIAESGIEAD